MIRRQRTLLKVTLRDFTMPFHITPEPGQPNRREFLGGLLAAGFAASFPKTAQADEKLGYFALLSDTHVAADPSTIARGQRMAANLGVVVSQILDQKEAPARVLVDGDLALKDGQEGDYKSVMGLLAPLRKAKLPIHLTMGNHDDRDKFRSTLKGVIPIESRIEEKQVGSVEALGCRLVLLDSLDKTNVTPGELGTKQLDWLKKDLDAQPDKPTLIFLHHNLKAAGEAGLTDDEALLALINPRKQVKAVIFGHTHTWDVRKNDQGIHLINLPAIGYPFAGSQPIGWTKLRPVADGAQLELFAVGGNTTRHGEKLDIKWR